MTLFWRHSQYTIRGNQLIKEYSLCLRISSCRTQHGYYAMGKGVKISSTEEAKHSCCSSFYCGADPFGMARTHRFATETVDVPAQVGERVTVAVAAPSNVYREVGLFRFSPRAPDFYPGEAMCLTNHKDGRESLLLRAPRKEGNSLLKPSFLFPLLAVFASGDAASGLIDPSLPQFISVVAASSLAVGVTLNSFVFPQLNQLPQGSVDAIAIKQQLLSQYDVLQSCIKDLKEDNIMEQIQQIMELENLEERWKIQAEANDEAERLLSSQSLPDEEV